MKNIKKLSAPQFEFLRILFCLLDSGYRCPFLGNREAGRAASAWHRTAKSLQDRGLCVLKRSGDSWRADISFTGLEYLKSLEVR